MAAEINRIRGGGILLFIAVLRTVLALVLSLSFSAYAATSSSSTSASASSSGAQSTSGSSASDGIHTESSSITATGNTASTESSAGAGSSGGVRASSNIISGTESSETETEIPAATGNSATGTAGITDTTGEIRDAIAYGDYREGTAAGELDAIAVSALPGNVTGVIVLNDNETEFTENIPEEAGVPHTGAKEMEADGLLKLLRYIGLIKPGGE